MRSFRVFLLLALVAPATLITAAPSGAISDACIFDAASATLTGIGGAVGYQYSFTREAGTNFITFTRSTGWAYCYDGPTKRATVKNTDTIEFFGTGSNEGLEIDLGGGPFAPGKTAEAHGASEIEFDLQLSSGSDELVVTGSDRNDKVTFIGVAAARLNGDSDNDVSASGVDYRTLYGNGGDDTLGANYPVPLSVYAGDGNDTVTGSDEYDYLFGGKGNDTLIGGGGNDNLYGEEGGDTLTGGDQNDYLVPGTGNDTANGGADDDSFAAQPGSDGADTLLGGPGDEDYVSYGDRSGRVVLDLDGVADDGATGEGDRIGKDVEDLAGGDGNDKLTGSAGGNSLYGGEGNDTIAGGGGDDYMRGSTGDDTIAGGDGDDGLYGDEDDDTLGGDAGNDTLVGGLGNDAANGGAGADSFYAEVAVDGADSMSGGSGRDSVSYQSRTGSLAIDLDNAADDGYLAENDNVRADIEYVTAGSGPDSLTGSSSANGLYGGGGIDTIAGLGGDDTLYGNDGNDILTGGDGYDNFNGGNDNDTLNMNDDADDYGDCGPGTDTANEDAYDTLVGCEA